MKSLTAIALLLLIQAPPALADQNDERLNDLFLELKEAENAIQALPIEQQIWRIWYEHENPEYERMLLRGEEQMNSNRAQAALETFSRLIELAPDWAEAWNRRATLHYLLGNYAESEADIVETLKLEPYHFGALSGRGLVYMEQREFFQARNAFNAALEVYPAMVGPKENLRALDEYLRDSAI